MSERKYTDSDGNEWGLEMMCIKEPGWAASRIVTLEAHRDRLMKILTDSFMHLPQVGDPIAWVDHNLVPHVIRVADEFAVLKEQVRAFRKKESSDE